MTFITIALHTEHGRAVMATAAGRAFLHLSHGKPFVFRAGDKQLIMTINAGIYRKMLIMAETGIIRKRNVFDRMALTACGDTEGNFAVMARSA